MNIRSIKFKLIALMAVSLLVIAVSIVTISLTKTSEALVQSNMALLDAVKESKKDHIIDFLTSIKLLILSKASDMATVETIWALEDSFMELEEIEGLSMDRVRSSLLKHYDTEYLNDVNYKMKGSSQRRPTQEYMPKSASGQVAQYLYIVDNINPVGEKEKLSMNKNYEAEYSKNHIEIHKAYTQLLKNFGLYDIFLVNKDGEVVYSVMKEKDYGTNLETGVYSNTGLGEAFKKAKKLSIGEVAFADFKPYEPSYNEPAMFLASPVIYMGDFEGVVIFQLPKAKINSVMSFGGNYEKAGLGKTGKANLVCQDGCMKNDSRFLSSIEDPDVKASGTTITVMNVKSASTDAIKEGKSGSWIIDDYRGVSVLSSYTPIEIFGQKWGMVVEIDEDEVLESVHAIRNVILGISVVIFIVLLLISIFLVQQLIITKLATLQSAAYDLAKGEGDLTQRISVPKGDEIYEVAENINAFIEKVRITVSEAKSSSSQNTGIAKTLSDASLVIRGKTEKEAQIVADVSEEGTTLQNVLKESIAQAKITKEDIDSAGTVLKGANDQIIHLAEEVQTRAREEVELAARLEQLSSDVTQVKEVLTVISDIADQTNLLALNAAIEAARAGEQGRGFAVVADEVRTLAGKTQQSAFQIEEMIDKLQGGAKSAVAAMDVSQEIAKKSVDEANHAGDSLLRITESMSAITDMNTQIAGAAEEQTSVAEEINRNIININDTANHAAVASGQTASSSQELARLAESLQQLVSNFKL